MFHLEAAYCSVNQSDSSLISNCIGQYFICSQLAHIAMIVQILFKSVICKYQYIHIYNSRIGHRFYWGPTDSPISLVVMSHFLGSELVGVGLATDLHLVPKLIMSVAIPLFCLVCAVTTVPLPLPYFEFHINLSKDKHV